MSNPTPAPSPAAVALDDRPYVARRPCGCAVILATRWAYDNDRDVRKSFADAMREGLAVERMDRETAVALFGNRCDACALRTDGKNHEED